MHKNLYSVLLIALVLVGGCWALNHTNQTVPQQEVVKDVFTKGVEPETRPEEPKLPTHIANYSNAKFGVTFDYMAGEGGLAVEEGAIETGWAPNAVGVIHLTSVQALKDRERFKGSGSDAGAPSISMVVFKNPEGLSPREWRQQPPQKSWDGGLFGGITDRTIAGASGIWYLTECLNGNCGTLILSHGDRMHHISGYVEDREPFRPTPDFAKVLETLRFLP